MNPIDIEIVEGALKAAFHGTRWELNESGWGHFDVSGHGDKGSACFKALLKAYRVLRKEELLGGFAMMILLQPKPAMKLNIALVPVATPLALSWTRAFYERTQDMETGWMLIGRDGHACLACFDSQSKDRRGERWIDFPVRNQPPATEPPRTKRPFTEMNRWMMKIMLLANEGEGRWGGPRCQYPQSVRDLQIKAMVAYETARTYVKTFEVLGYLSRSRRGLALARIQPMLHSLLAEQTLVASSRRYVRWALGRPQNLSEALRRIKGASEFVVGGWEACKYHEALIRGNSYLPLLHLTTSDRSVESTLSLIPCAKADAQLILEDSQKSKSIKGGAVHINGILTVDLLQAALDVVSDPVRGQEQVEHIFQLIGLDGTG